MSKTTGCSATASAPACSRPASPSTGRRTARAAELALAGEPYDAVVLDLGLPRLSGMEVLARLRAARNAVPVLILTARDTVPDRIAGLDAGADDYLVKPFDLGELQARLRALIRRGQRQAEPLLRARRACARPGRRAASAGRASRWSCRHANSPCCTPCCSTPAACCRSAQLEEKLYGWGEEIESNAVEVFVHHLRRKLAPELIRTVRGVGYMIPREAG